MVGSMELGKDAVISKVIPSTPSQMEIWLQCHLGGKEANMAYNESNSIRLLGDLKLNYLKDAFQTVISRHEAMRALFTPDGKKIIIFSSYEVPIRFRDISEYADDKKKQFLKKHSKDTGLYEFDLVRGPLYVLEVIKINRFEHMLTFTGHHLIFDGWSMALFAEEISTAYGQLCAGKAIELPKAHRLSDYVLKNHRQLNSKEFEKSRKFWLEKLSNPVPFLELPVDFKRPAIRNLKAGRVEYKAPTNMMLKAKRFANTNHVSLNVLLLSIYELFLSQWIGSNDVVLGMPRAGQPLLGCSQMIGHSVHLLPIRAKVDLELTFEEYLVQRRKEFVDVLDHGMVSFGELIQSLHIKRDPSRIPLLPLTFNIEIGLEQGISFADLRCRLISNPKAYGNFEVLLNLFGSLKSTTFEWTYNESLFKESTIYDAAVKYSLLIEKILEQPSQKLTFIKDLFEEVDISELLDLVNVDSPEAASSVPQVILDFQETAAIYAEKAAVITNGTSISYTELNQQSNQLALLLREKGVQPGDFVGVYLERSNETIVSILGILKAGAAYLPIDVEIPDDRVIYMLKDSGSKYFITDQSAFEHHVLSEKRLVFEALKSEFHKFSPTNDPVKTHLESPMYIIYTSGSTGNPKGVLLTHKNVDYFCNEAIKDLNFKSKDVIASVTSVSFDVATLELLVPYKYGSTVYMLDKFQRKDPKEILKFLATKGITKMFATPTHWQMLVNSGWDTEMPLLSVLSAGEPLKKSLVDQLSTLSKEIFNLYGPSETTVFSTLKKVDPSESQVTIGKEVPGTKIYFVDQSGNLVTKPDTSGEIWIGGDAVGKSYLGLPELSAEKFIANPFEQFPRRLYKTGDLGYRLANGEIHCEGRIDHQVKIRGHRIELGEIEQRILKFAEVVNAVVATDQHQDFTNLVAFIIVRPELRQELNLNDFAQDLKQRLAIGLPEYMVPAEFRFVKEFQLTTSGKIDRKQLFTHQEHSQVISLADAKGSEPEGLSKVESGIYAIWKEVLGAAQIDLDADFFLIGGHSLLGVQLISAVEKQFQISLSLLTLFQYPTVRSFAAFIAQETFTTGSDSLVLIKHGSPHKVLCFVHGVGLNPIEINTLIKNMDEDQTIWGLQSPAVSGNADPFLSIPEMAKHYIQELDTNGIKQPYNLIGNSIGGLIVFEMAKQLLAANREVGFISMIDTIGQFHQDHSPSMGAKIHNFFRRLKFETQFVADDLPYYLKHRKRNLQEKWRNFKGRGSQENDLSTRIREIEVINEKAWFNYEIESVDVDITLFLAQKKTFFVKDFETLGWRKYTRKVERYTMPGEHANMLKPPYGSEFTKVLQQKLNEYIAR